MKHLNIGLLGFGFMGKTHLWAVKNLPFFYDLPSAVCFHAHFTANAALSNHWK